MTCRRNRKWRAKFWRKFRYKISLIDSIEKITTYSLELPWLKGFLQARPQLFTLILLCPNTIAFHLLSYLSHFIWELLPTLIFIIGDHFIVFCLNRWVNIFTHFHFSFRNYHLLYPQFLWHFRLSFPNHNIFVDDWKKIGDSMVVEPFIPIFHSEGNITICLFALIVLEYLT